MSARRSSTAAAPASEAAGPVAHPALLVTLVALAVRLVALWRVPELTYDGTYYLRQAERLAHFHFDPIAFPPGYPLLVALVQPLVRDPVWAARGISFVAGMVSAWLAYRLARRHLGAGLALVAGLVLAVHPHLAKVQVETLSESTYLACILGGVLLWESRRDLAAGALFGFAFLVRPEAFALYVGLLALRAWRDRGVPWRLGVGLVLVVAYAAVASHAVGHLVLSPKQGQLDVGRALLDRLVVFTSILHSSYPLLLLPLAVWFGARRAPHLLLPLVYVLVLPFFAIHLQERLLAPALPFLVILGLGGVTLLQPMWRRPVAIAAAMLALLGTARGFAWLVASEPLTPDARRIGAALRPHLQWEDRVAGRFPLVAYHAGAGFLRAPREASYDAMLDSIVVHGATHLLVLESEMAGILPQLRPLFTDANFAGAEGRLRQVASVPEPEGGRALLYRVVGAPVDPDSARVLRRDVDVATWSATLGVAATVAGELVRWPPGEALGVSGARQPCLSPDGTRLVCVRDAPRPVIGNIDLASGLWIPYAATMADAPAWPTWVGERVVYVRQAEPPGLRVLDPRTGSVHVAQFPGVGTDRAVPLFVTGRPGEVAITFRPLGRETRGKLVIATAGFPPITGADVLLEGRWATELRLADPVTSWVPNENRVVASIVLATAEGLTTAERSTLCIVQPDGTLRRLTYNLTAARRPALGGGGIAFLTDDGDLRRVRLDSETLRMPPLRVFPLPTLPAGG